MGGGGGYGTRDLYTGLGSLVDWGSVGYYHHFSSGYRVYSFEGDCKDYVVGGIELSDNNFKIRIRDFQSLEDAKVDLVDGLNVVVGGSNEGKSAIFRAITAALFNSGSDEDVRVGSSGQSIIGIDNGEHSFIFRRDAEKKSTKTAYKIDGGKEVTKVGRNQLEEISELFRITDVRMANNVMERVNFWDQGKNPFLMDRTSGQLYEFLSLSSCDKYLEILKIMKSDIKKLSVDSVSLTASIDTLQSVNNEKEEFITKNKGFKDVYERSVVLNERVNDCNRVETLIDRIVGLKEKVRVKQEELDQVQKELDQVDLKSVSTRYDKLESLYSSFVSVGKSIGTIKKKNKSLGLVLGRLSEVRKESDFLSGGLGKISPVVMEIESKSTVYISVQSYVAKMQKRIQKRDELQDELDRKLQKINGIDLVGITGKVTTVEKEIGTVGELGTCIQRVKNRKSTLETKTDELGRVEKEYRDKEEEFSTFKEEIGVCPYCESDLKKNNP